VENTIKKNTYCKIKYRKTAISETNHSGIAANISGIFVGNIISVFGINGLP